MATPDQATALRTDTPEEQLLHYPLVSARRSSPLDDRAAWTANRHQVNEITAAEVRSSVSTKAADYATADEKAAAVAELNAVWLQTAKAVRVANKAAKAVFPLSWTRATHAAYFNAYDALTPEHRALVSFARDLRDARHELYEVAKWLQRYGIVKYGSVRRFEDLTGDSCPTFTAIVARIAAAGEKAVAEYVARIQSLPVDDEAWARELAGREEREAWFRNGPVVQCSPAATETARERIMSKHQVETVAWRVTQVGQPALSKDEFNATQRENWLDAARHYDPEASLDDQR